jgi:hypothetical protein
MTTARDHLSKADSVTIAAIEERVPTLVEARKLVERFQVMMRQKLIADLDPWIVSASVSLISSFASGITKDKEAVRRGRPVWIRTGSDRNSATNAPGGVQIGVQPELHGIYLNKIR